MNSLALLLLGLLCIGSGICEKQAKLTHNQQPEIHHLSSGPRKTFIRILPHGVELSHDQHLAVHFISSLPTKKCKKSTTQNQYQQLRLYLRRNLKQLGKGIIVLTNLTKTQSQDVAAIAAAINSSEDGQCEEEINTKGISRLIQALMLAVQNDNSYKPPKNQPKTFPKALRNGRVLLPLNKRVHSRLQMGLPQGYKRMAFSHGGVPGATPENKTKGIPITAFQKKRNTYYEFPTKSDDAWTLIDPVEKNKTHPMLFIMGQKPEKRKTNKKIYKYYDLPLTEEKAKKNTDGNFKLLNKRWKIPSQLNASDHCDIDSQNGKCNIRKPLKMQKPEDSDSLEVDEFWSKEPRSKRNRRPKYEKGQQDAEETSAEGQQRRYSDSAEINTMSNKPKRKRKPYQPKYENYPVKSDFPHDSKEIEKPKQNETPQASDKIPSSDTTYDEPDSKETSVESQAARGGSDLTEDDKPTISSKEKLEVNSEIDHGSKEKRPNTLETSVRSSNDQLNNDKKLVDEEDLDNNNKEKNSPSKVSRYDDMMKDMPIGKLDFGDVRSAEVVEHGEEAFDMDIEIDPWIF